MRMAALVVMSYSLSRRSLVVHGLPTGHYPRILCLAAILALSGCAQAPTASMPTPVACAPKNAPSPPTTTANADLAKLDDRQLVLTIASERLDLIDYAGKADAIIQACR